MSRQASRSFFIIHHSSFLLALIILSFACAPREARVSSAAPPPAPVRDDLGRTVAVPARVTRIVTLAPNLTEIVFAIGAGASVVATDDFSDEPAAAKVLPKVGGLQPNIEKIVGLNPDLVLATTNGNHPNLAPALAAVHIPLYVVRTDRIEEISQAMERLSALLHAPRASAANELRAQVAQQKRVRQPAPRVLFAVWADPLFVGGRKTFADDLLVLAGAENAVPVDGWPQYSLESLVANPPDLILYPSKPVSRAQIDKLLDVAPALKRRVAIVAVDENLFTRPGPRVAIAAAELNRILDQTKAGAEAVKERR
jgi:iron complex transport system substrate-binding protein